MSSAEPPASADISRDPQPRGRRPSRRQVLALGAGAFVVAAIPFVRGRRERLVRRQVPVMGTLADLAVVVTDERAGHDALDAAIERLRFVDRGMTRFQADSDVGRVNGRSGSEPVVVGEATATVLQEALLWAETTDGAFDPCLGRAVELWNVTERARPPLPARRLRYAGRRLYRGLDVSTSRSGWVVRLGEEDAALDLGGIAKGYGVDLAVQAIRESGIERGLVNVGGDLYALGRSEDGDPWRVGIQSPEEPGALAGTLEIEDQAIATSGDYERCFRHEGRPYHHLLDPTTGAPRRTSLHSVTVAASTCLRADAAATTAFTLSGDRVEDVLRQRAPGARVLSRI